MTTNAPDSTAVRVALWRALHVLIDSSPPILDDQIGLRLAAPDENWQQRPDMHPQGTRGYRTAIVARAKFVEDLVLEKLKQGVCQYVILGAGLDTFAQRRPDVGSKLKIFEVDKPGTQEWKKQRLRELGYGLPDFLKFVPVDFEAGASWPKQLAACGFDAKKPAVIASTGVAMYLTREANLATLRQITQLAPGSTLVMSFLLPVDMVDPEERAQFEMVQERARAAGTPFVSLFRPAQILELAREAGFTKTEHISRTDIIGRYFAGRSDNLKPASGEEILVATV